MPSHADLGEVPAEAAIAVEERGLGTRARGRQGRRESTWAAPDDEHLGFMDDVDRARRLRDPEHVAGSRVPLALGRRHSATAKTGAGSTRTVTVAPGTSPRDSDADI